jgi:hypothetical protein
VGYPVQYYSASNLEVIRVVIRLAPTNHVLQDAIHFFSLCIDYPGAMEEDLYCHEVPGNKMVSEVRASINLGVLKWSKLSKSDHDFFRTVALNRVDRADRTAPCECFPLDFGYYYLKRHPFPIYGFRSPEQTEKHPLAL